MRLFGGGDGHVQVGPLGKGDDLGDGDGLLGGVLQVVGHSQLEVRLLWGEKCTAVGSVRFVCKESCG